MSEPTANKSDQRQPGLWIASIVVSAAVAIHGTVTAGNAVWELSRWTPRGLTIPPEITAQFIIRCAAGFLFLFIPVLLLVSKRRFLALRAPYQVLVMLIIPAVHGLILWAVPPPIAEAPNVITIGMAENGRLFTDFNHDRHYHELTDGHTFSHSAYNMTIRGSVNAPADEQTYSVTIDLENLGEHGFALFIENLEQVTVTREGQEIEITSPRLPAGKYRVVVAGKLP